MDNTDKQVERDEGARMAGHFKLGLAIIGALIITLVIVAFKTLGGGGDDEGDTVATKTESSEESTVRGGRTWQAQKPRHLARGK